MTRELRENIEVRDDTIAGAWHKMMEEEQLSRRRKGKQTVLSSLGGDGNRERVNGEGEPLKTSLRFFFPLFPIRAGGGGPGLRFALAGKVETLITIRARGGTALHSGAEKNGQREAGRTRRNPTATFDKKASRRDDGDSGPRSIGDGTPRPLAGPGRSDRMLGPYKLVHKTLRRPDAREDRTGRRRTRQQSARHPRQGAGCAQAGRRA